MIALSHTVPTKYLDTFSSYSTYCLVLAHLVGDDKDYTKFFQEEKRKGKYIVLDNGAYEKGISIPDKDLLQKAILLGADEIICPDVWKDSENTIKRTREFLHYVNGESKLKNFQFMFVPQGETLEKWIFCFNNLSVIPLFNTLGLSFIAVPIKRIWIYEYIWETNTRCVHLLGLENCGNLELKYFSNFKEVIRCDTSSAFQFAFEGIELKEKLPYKRIVRKLDFNTEFDEKLLPLFNRNMQVLNNCGKGSK